MIRAGREHQRRRSPGLLSAGLWTVTGVVLPGRANEGRLIPCSLKVFRVAESAASGSVVVRRLEFGDLMGPKVKGPVRSRVSLDRSSVAGVLTNAVAQIPPPLFSGWLRTHL